MRSFACLLLLLLLAGPATAETSLQNERLRIAFDAQGRLISLRNRATGQEYYHGPGRRILRVLCRSGQGLREAALRFAGARPAGKQALALTYAGEGLTARVTLRIPASGAKTAWMLDLENRGNLEALEVVFPDLDRLKIGDDGTDDFLVRPNRYGQRIPNPSVNLFRDTGEIVDGMPYHAALNTPTLIYNGSAGMFWMDLYDAGGGLYLAAEDKRLRGGYLTCGEGDGIGMALGKYIRVARGQRLRLEYAVGVHPGDWRWGAAQYRAWAGSFMRKPRMPRWAREMPNWYWRAMLWSMGAERPPLKTPFLWSDLDGALLDGALGLRGGVIGLAGQEFLGHDFAFWWPDPALGGEAMLRERLRRVNRRGGHVVPYLNPIYTWEGFPAIPHADDADYQRRLAQAPPDADAPRPEWERFRDHVARLYDGGFNRVEQHYFGNNAQTCLLDRAWQDYVLWWTHKYATDYGFSGVQWDQLGAYPIQYCDDPRHGHDSAGTGPAGTLELCRRIYSDPAYRVPPDFYIWYEGASDVAAQYLQNGHSGFDMWMAYGFPEMIQYTFPDRLFSGDHNPPAGSRGEALIRQQRTIEMSFLCREKLGSGGGEQHGGKLEAVARLTVPLKGLYWYTSYRGEDGLSAPDGLWMRVLEIDPAICPYVRERGLVLPYADLRREKGPCEIRLSKARWSGLLTAVCRVYWYPGALQGMRRELRLEDAGPDGFRIRLPEAGPVNLFTRQQAYCAVDDTVSQIGAIVVVPRPLRPLRVLGPATARRGEEVVFRTVEAVVEGDGGEVSATPGAPAGTGGLVPVEVSDGRPTPGSAQGKPCWKLGLPDAPYLYLAARDPAMRGVETLLEVSVDYLDEGHDTFRLQYNSSDPYAAPYRFGEFTPLYKGSPILHKEDTGRWRTATFLLPDALLTGGMNGGADIRLDAQGGRHAIGTIRVARKRVRYVPVPGVTLRVGSDARRTDARGELRYRFAADDPTGVYLLDAYRADRSGVLPGTGLIRVE